MSEHEKKQDEMPEEDLDGENEASSLDEMDAEEAGLLNEELIDFTPEDLAGKLEEANNKAQENWEKLVRAMAEIDNLRKRHERDLESAHKYGLERFANELLQVRDSLELGHQAAQDKDADVEKLREGTELTLKLLTDVMGKFGVEQVDPEGEAFNPEQHQAMSMQARDGVEPNTVVQVVQKGYLLNGRLLRPAMVIVTPAT